ncbi:MAG: SpoIIE family protein phosphatase, partial [Chloroflexota bacterium]|nr:SpoIIE family protein phosphatase [Chloroflexota bacterium]
NVEMFLLLALGLVGTAIVVQRFADASVHLERRRREMLVMNEFGNALARAVFASEKVIDLLHEHAQRIVSADVYRIELAGSEHAAGALLALDATAREMRHPYETQAKSPLFDYFSTHHETVRGVDLARSFVQPLDATGAAIAAGNRVQIDGHAPRSALFVPMFAGDEFIGVLSLFATRPRAFFPIHGRNLESMCGQAAVTIQNARLYAVERKRAGQLATVSEVSRQVAALMDLDELLQKVVNQVRERFGYSHVHIFTVDGGYAVFRASTHPRGAEWRERGVGYRIGLEGMVGWVAAMGEPLIVGDVSQDPRFVPYPDMEMDSTRSEIVVPLTIGKRVIGVLDVESRALNAFGDEDLFVLKTLAAQIAVAVEDARLFNAQKEEAYFLNVMLQVAENLSATTDLDEALETVVRITPLLVGVIRCAVLLYRPAEKRFLPAKVYGLSREMQDAFAKFEFRSDDQYALAKMYRDQAPLMIEDAAASKLLRPDFLETFATHSLLLAPLTTRGEIVGALIVDQGARPRRFSQREVDVVMGIANQAAVAIEGARLSQEAEGKKRLEYELGLARQIQKSFLPDLCPMLPGYEICSVWQTAREVSGDFYDFVSLHDGRLGITIADVSDKGMAAAMFMALSRTILRTMAIGKPTPRETVERANDVILADARSEMFVTVFYAVLDPQSHRLTYVNAGHNPPLLYRAEENQVTTLKGHGMALGVFAGISLDEHTIDLEPGDVLLMYTDGVTDAFNAQEEEFGAARLADLVGEQAHLSVERMTEEIVRALKDFAGEGVQFDDVTMVALKRET